MLAPVWPVKRDSKGYLMLMLSLVRLIFYNKKTQFVKLSNKSEWISIDGELIVSHRAETDIPALCRL